MPLTKKRLRHQVILAVYLIALGLRARRFAICHPMRVKGRKNQKDFSSNGFKVAALMIKMREKNDAAKSDYLVGLGH